MVNFFVKDLLFKIDVRRDRHCILVAGHLDPFFTGCNWQRTSRGPGLNFRELMNGRIRMMTAMCFAWVYVYQTSWLGFESDQLRPGAFRLSNTYRVLRLETLHRWLLRELFLAQLRVVLAILHFQVPLPAATTPLCSFTHSLSLHTWPVSLWALPKLRGTSRFPAFVSSCCYS